MVANMYMQYLSIQVRLSERELRTYRINQLRPYILQETSGYPQTIAQC